MWSAANDAQRNGPTKVYAGQTSQAIIVKLLKAWLQVDRSSVVLLVENIQKAVIARTWPTCPL